MAKKQSCRRKTPSAARHEAVSLARMEEIARLYLRGKSQASIGEQFGITQQAVSKGLLKARELWRERIARAYEDHLAEALRKLAEIEAAAWEGWERSCKVLNSQRSEDGENAHGSFSKTIKTQRWEYGDPQFLTVIERCVARSCELLGLMDKDSGNSEGDEDRLGVVEVRVDTREEAEVIKLSVAEFTQQRVG